MDGIISISTIVTQRLLIHRVPLEIIQKILHEAFNDQIIRYPNLYHSRRTGWVDDFFDNCRSCGILVLGRDEYCQFCHSFVCEYCVLPGELNKREHPTLKHIPASNLNHKSNGCNLCKDIEFSCRICDKTETFYSHWGPHSCEDHQVKNVN